MIVLFGLFCQVGNLLWDPTIIETVQILKGPFRSFVSLEAFELISMRNVALVLLVAIMLDIALVFFLELALVDAVDR